MGIGSAASGGLGMGMGIYNTIQGAKQASDAEDALNKYKRQELKNIAEGLQVSTMGADLQREEQARLASGQIGAAREAGTRGMIGSLGRIEAGNQRVNQQIGADLDMQQKQIDQMRAQDEANLRNMQENRENQDISALSSQYNAGKQGQADGLSQVTQSASMLGNSLDSATKSLVSPMSGGAGGLTTSGNLPDMSNPANQSLASSRYNPESGYATAPILTNQSYNPANYGPQNSINPFALPNPYQVTKR